MDCFLIVTMLWILSVSLHEWGHSIVALYGGDDTVREKGYLTLNPFVYAHPIYSFVLPVVFLMFGGIGLPGGAVYINNHLLRSRGWRTAVSLAGPAVNIVLVFLLWLPFKFGWLSAMNNQLAGPALAFLIMIELSSIVLCLLPVPPMDGFQALAPWLPEGLGEKLMGYSNVTMMILFVVLMNSDDANRVFFGVIRSVLVTMGIDTHLVAHGWETFQFWKAE